MVHLNESKLVKSAGSLSGDFFKIYLVRRRTKTQKYKGAVFEQLESGWAYVSSVENETKQKTRQQNKTQGSKQGKQTTNQNIRVLTPL